VTPEKATAEMKRLRMVWPSEMSKQMEALVVKVRAAEETFGSSTPEF
jgi:hypothetical protein